MYSETAISILIVGGIFLFWQNGLETNKNHIAMKLLYNLMSLWLTVLGSNMAYQFSVSDGLSSGIQQILAVQYQVLLYVVLFTTGYWIIMFIKDIVLNMGRFKMNKDISDRQEGED